MAKPTLVQHSVTKVACKSCGSRFLLSCWRDKESAERVFKTDVELLFLSDKAKTEQSKTIKTKMLRNKVLGEPDDFLLETHLDELE